MLERRGFIGSVIGMVSGLPFFAETINKKPLTIFDRIRLLSVIPTTPKDKLMQFKIAAIINVDGEIKEIMMPKLEEVKIIEDEELELIRIIFEAKKMLVKNNFVLKGFIILNSKYQELKRTNDQNVTCQAGDNLIATYTFTAGPIH